MFSLFTKKGVTSCRRGEAEDTAIGIRTPYATGAQMSVPIGIERHRRHRRRRNRQVRLGQWHHPEHLWGVGVQRCGHEPLRQKQPNQIGKQFDALQFKQPHS